MLIFCPSCTTSYMIELASLGPGGRYVRCARCRETWFVNPPQVDEPVGAFVSGVIAETGEGAPFIALDGDRAGAVRVQRRGDRRA